MSTAIPSSRTNPSSKRLTFLAWVLVAVFYFHLSSGYIRVVMDDREFGDYLQYVVNVAGSEHRPNREVRDLILVRAEQLSLPLHRDQVVILGDSQTLNVRVNYSTNVDVPILRGHLYTKEFSHDVKYRVNR